jgi:hypothetical protein
MMFRETGKKTMTLHMDCHGFLFDTLICFSENICIFVPFLGYDNPDVSPKRS